MHAPIDMKDRICGRLRVIEKADTRENGLHWLCECSCGNRRVIAGSSLRSGKTVSCGCFLKEVLKRRPQTRLVHSTNLKEREFVGYKEPVEGPRRGARVYWTSDDIILFVVCRKIYYMSYNDIARILCVATQTVVELAERLGLYVHGEVLVGRNPHWHKLSTIRRNVTDSW